MIKQTINMALVDLKKIYKGTLLGWFWLIAKPATTILVYWFAFSVGLRVDRTVNGHQYFFWLISGMIAWFFISEIIATSPSAFKKYNYLVTKMKFPILTIPIFTSLSRLIVHTILIMICILLFQVAGNGLSLSMIQLIPMTLLNFIFLATISIIFALLGSISKDIGEFLKTIITPLLFLTPIVWDINKIDSKILLALQEINPINFIVKGYRNVLIYDRPFYDDAYSLIIFLLILTLLMMIASNLYRKLRKELPDYL